MIQNIQNVNIYRLNNTSINHGNNTTVVVNSINSDTISFKGKM